MSCISYAMGVNSNILKLKKFGFKIREDYDDKEINYEVIFDEKLAPLWERFIQNNIKNTYWNEYINLDTGIIIFNINDNRIERVVYKAFTSNPRLLHICNRLCEGNFHSMKELIMSNDFYKKHLKKRYN